MKKISSIQYAVKNESDGKQNIAHMPTSTLFFNGMVIAQHETTSDSYKIILKALQIAIRSDWFIHKIKNETQGSYLKAISSFFDWIKLSQKLCSYMIIKDFETYEINRGLKPQSTSARKVMTILRKGLLEDGLAIEEYRFLTELCQKTRLMKYDKPESTNLSQWFARHQWIRSQIDDDYYRLASPKRIMKSFVVTVASTLIELLNARKHIRGNKDLYQHYVASCAVHKSSRAGQNLVAALLKSANKVSNLRQAQTLKVIQLECIKRSHEGKVQTSVSLNGVEGYEKALEGISSNYPYYRPLLFISEKLSVTEQLLMYFLLCSLAIQPTDASKITKDNFSIKRNRAGKPRYIRVEYKKGRGDIYHEPPLLRTGDIVFEAIELYLSSISPNEYKLFSEDIMKAFTLSNPNFVGRYSNPPNTTSTLLKLWSDSEFAETLNQKFDKHKTDSLFLKAFRCFFQPDVMTYNVWAKSEYGEGFYNDYCERAGKTCPQSLFKGSHIKNSSVYSRTDQYRDEDLINTNSHSSLTEKLSYMTDANKEWVNQVGRILRMVLVDIEMHAFSPNIDSVEAEVYDLRLKTKIISENEAQTVKVNDIGKIIEKASAEDSFIVIDSVENAILMLHYIDQAESYYKLFVEVNPEFLQSNLLVNVEWMYHCLGLFSPSHLQAASKKYPKIKNVLPNLFEHELATGFSL